MFNVVIVWWRQLFFDSR